MRDHGSRQVGPPVPQIVEEIKENERLWREENLNNLTPTPSEKQSLRGVGISSTKVDSGIASQTGEAEMDFSMDAVPGNEVGADLGAAAPPAPLTTP